MCSRYSFVFESRAWGDVAAWLGPARADLLAAPARPHYAPTDAVPIVVQRPGAPPEVAHARWAFIPHWWSKPELPRTSFNARAEEAARKPMWRDAWKHARCLIPATRWYEWQHVERRKIPHELSPVDGRAFFFAGLWSHWRPPGRNEAMVTCAILTTAATPAIAAVHDRMPVVLAPEAWPAWIDPALTDPGRVAEMVACHTVSALRVSAIAPA